jgi:excisionase family DNA binding protein
MSEVPKESLAATGHGQGQGHAQGSSRLLTTGEIARYCDVSTNAVKKWIRSNRLKAFRTPGGHFRVDSRDFREFLVQHQMPVYDSFFELEPKKILIVDDEKEVRQTLREVLEGLEGAIAIDMAEDGYEALLKVGDLKPDLLILDLRMPRMDGYEACRRIKSNPETSSTRILAISGFIENGAEQEILQCGATDWMRKPVQIEEFKKKIEKLLKP